MALPANGLSISPSPHWLCVSVAPAHKAETTHVRFWLLADIPAYVDLCLLSGVKRTFWAMVSYVRFGSKADIDRDLLTDNFHPWLALGAIQNYSRIYIDIEKILFPP